MSTSAKVAPSAKVVSKQKKQVPIVIDDEGDGEPGRTTKRLTWTQEEDIRLAGAWLENSNDPINGNNKNEQYWSDIAALYNSVTPKDRRSDASQLKLCFHHEKAKINKFHGCWSSVTKVYRSGMSDDQLIDMALGKYQSRHSKHFTMLHMWKKLKGQAKWLAYMEKMNEEENKNTSVVTDNTSPVVEVEELPHPIGSKKAKAEHNGKCKVREAPEVVMVLGEKLDKFIEVQAASRQERQKVVELQERMSREKLETARLQKESKMLDVYKELMFADTSGMDDDAKASRAKALRVWD